MKLARAFLQNQGNEPALQYEDGKPVAETYCLREEEIPDNPVLLIQLVGAPKEISRHHYKDGQEITPPTFH